MDRWNRRESFWTNFNYRDKFFQRRDTIYVSTIRNQLENLEIYIGEISEQHSSSKCGCIQLDNHIIKKDLIKLMEEWKKTMLNDL